MNELAKIPLPWPSFFLLWAFLLACAGGVIYVFLYVYNLLNKKVKRAG